jgi:hypothetical protein
MKVAGYARDSQINVIQFKTLLALLSFFLYRGIGFSGFHPDNDSERKKEIEYVSETQ